MFDAVVMIRNLITKAKSELDANASLDRNSVMGYLIEIYNLTFYLEGFFEGMEMIKNEKEGTS